MNVEEFAGHFEHTLLKAETGIEQIRQHCTEAVQIGCAGVCIHPRWVAEVSDVLHGSGVKVVSVAGFPFGAHTTKMKVNDAKSIIAAGADEVDMVAAIDAIVSGDEKYLLGDIAAVAKVCKSYRPGVILKVIIESAVLTDEQIEFVCRVCQTAGADYIKTSTGLHPAGGASVEAVKLMARTAPVCRVKAAGGIRTSEEAVAMIQAGASRIGASATVKIVEQFKQNDLGGQ